ncbi:MAG: hypothetical protein RSA79_03070 [Oscillospiraceae bacterium]
MNISVTVEGDSEGFVTFECPFCGSEFKLQAGEFQDENENLQDLFCPYCGLTGEKDTFYHKDVIEQIQALAKNCIIEELNNASKKMSKSINKPHSNIKMTYKPLKKVETKELKDKDTAEVEFKCGHCEHMTKVLYCAGASKIFCPYCGVDI